VEAGAGGDEEGHCGLELWWSWRWRGIFEVGVDW